MSNNGFFKFSVFSYFGKLSLKVKCPKISCLEKNLIYSVFKHAMLMSSLAHTDYLSAYLILSGKITISSVIIKKPENCELFWDVIFFNIFIVNRKYLKVFSLRL